PASLYSCFLTGSTPTELSPLSLHDALPISEATAAMPSAASAQPCTIHCRRASAMGSMDRGPRFTWPSPTFRAAPTDEVAGDESEDRKSTRLNSSHVKISYAVFCLKKKNKMR